MANLSTNNRRPSVFRDFERQFNEMFDEFFSPRRQGREAWQVAPLCDVSESDQHYFMSFDVPGVKKEDIHIEVDNNILTISGERQYKEGEGQRSHVTERSYGQFSRSFSLPQGVDEGKIEANYEDGVLSLAIPKTERAQARKIQVKEGSGRQQGRVVGQSQSEKKH